MTSFKESIVQESSRLGFTSCGFARAEPLQKRKEFYRSFVAAGRQGELGYLKSQMEKRLDPRLVMPEAKSVITVLRNYYPPETIPVEDNFIISRYAYGSDHHPFMRKKLKALSDFILSQNPGTITKHFIDSGVLLEKYWAQQCGAGWQGKNTLLINKHRGSFFFIGIILTSLELEADTPETDHCGTCDRCSKACPTHALDTPYQLEITRCLSYHTIETKGDFPEEFRPVQMDRIYGCDICQDACPFNRKATPHDAPELMPSEELKRLRKPDWRKMTEEDFILIFRKSAIQRTGYRKMMGNLPEQADK